MELQEELLDARAAANVIEASRKERGVTEAWANVNVVLEPLAEAVHDAARGTAGLQAWVYVELRDVVVAESGGRIKRLSKFGE